MLRLKPLHEASYARHGGGKRISSRRSSEIVKPK